MLAGMVLALSIDWLHCPMHSIVTRLFAMAMKKRLNRSIQVIPDNARDAGGAVLNKRETMISYTRWQHNKGKGSMIN